MDGIKFDVDGFDEVVMAIKKIADDTTKAKKIKDILRRQSKPAVGAIRGQIKDAKRNVTKTTKSADYNYTPGNLKRSIRIKTRGIDYPTAFIGANVPRRSSKNSGYYGYFVQYGTNKKKGGIKRPNNFVQKASDNVSGTIGNVTSEELKKYLAKEFKNKGFQVV